MADGDLLSEELLFGNRLLVDETKKGTVKFYLPIKNLLNHVFICGDASSDKTVFGKTILEEMILKEIPSIIIDLDGQLSSLALLIDNHLSKNYLDLWKNMEKSSSDFQETARRELEKHFKHLESDGYNDEYVRQFKNSVEFGIFTPRSGRAIPLAVPALINPPENIAQLCEEEKEDIICIINLLVTSLLCYLYADENIADRIKEGKLLFTLVLHAWLNKINLEGPAGFESLIEMVTNPPVEKIDTVAIEDFIPRRQKQSLIQKLSSFLTVEEQLWYKGVPLDIDLIFGRLKKPGKTPVVIINLMELGSFKECVLVVSRIIFVIYSWMKKQPESSKPRLAFYIDEIGGEVNSCLYPAGSDYVASKEAINLLLSKGKTSGVCCILGAENIQNIDYKGLEKCKTLCVGKFSAEQDKSRIIDGLLQTGVKIEKIGILLDSIVNGEFIIGSLSNETVLVKKKPLVSFHSKLIPSFLPRIVNTTIKEDFKPFYVLNQADACGTKKSTIFTPEVIFENSDFSIGIENEFVLKIEPEEALRLFFKELNKESIFIEEINFKNAQLVVTRVHKASWKVDALIRDSMGMATEHIKDEGVYTRFDSFAELTDEHKDELSNMADSEINARSSEICRKAAVLIPDSNQMTRQEAIEYVCNKLEVPEREVSVFLKEQNVAVGWRFVIEYRKKIIEGYVDIIGETTKVNFPVFSIEEAREEVKKLYPDFDIKKDNISSRAFSYIVNHDTQDSIYIFKVSKRSCKILNEKVVINEDKAREIAFNKVNQEPYVVSKHGNRWNFYYDSGLRLIIDEENGNVVSKEVVSADKVETLAKENLVKYTGDSDFNFIKKEFKEGKWILDFISDKWEAKVEIDENGKVSQCLKLQKKFSLTQARKILNEYKISAAMQKSSDTWEDGWEFSFLSSFGDLIIRISPQKKEFLKKRLTIEGVRHFINMDVGGEITGIKDRQAFWDITLKKDKQIYRVEVNKQNGSIQRTRVKKNIFWKAADITSV